MTVSRGMKKEISEEIGDLLVDVARLADRLETEEKLGKLDDPRFVEWFSTVENQVDTLNGFTEEIHRMLQTSEDAGEDNPLKAVKTMSPSFHISPSGISGIV